MSGLTMQRKTMLRKLGTALNNLFEQDRTLFDVNIHGRTLTGTLCHHLRPHFPGWTVDPEYDRRERERKMLPRGGTQHRIIPDIVIHHRRERRNLLAIEMKTRGQQTDARDAWKLRGLTDPKGQYGYKCGVHLVIDCGSASVARATVYDEGVVNHPLTAWFNTLIEP
jgi:hypothetical protein